MNKKLLSLLIPVLGGMAIVGSGFSAWYFGENAISKNVAGNGTVTKVATNGGTITCEDTFALKIDQGGKKTTADKYDEGGVSLTKVNGDAYTISYAVDADFEAHYGDSLTGYSVTVVVAEDSNYAASLNEYFDFVLSTDTFAKGATSEATLTASFKNAKKPTSEEAYKTMIQAFGAAEDYDVSTDYSFEGLKLVVTVSPTIA